jgi:beta-glucanase (GH16 family)
MVVGVSTTIDGYTSALVFRSFTEREDMKKLTIFGLIALTILLSAWSWPDRHHRPRPRPTPTATVAPTKTPTTTPTGYTFADEFNGSQVDTSLWDTCKTLCDSYNNELEGYLSSNVSEHDGYLDLMAAHQQIGGYPYTSGKVMSNKQFTYGHFEARVLIPYGQGYWPAFWLVAVSGKSSNELDIMESINTDHTDYMSDHYNLNGQFLHATSETPITDGWHVLALDWQKDKLVWFIDGVAKFSITDPNKIPGTQMNIILNLAIGGDWPGSPNSSTVFPVHFLVDYVRVL